jgi:hypothetical protein
MCQDHSPSSDHASGRPLAGEYADYAAADIASVPGDDAVEALRHARAETLTLLRPLTGRSADGLAYAPGKWTVKEVVGHLIDDERIFVYRALCLARGDTRELAGFDQDAYVPPGGFEQRTLADLLDEYEAVREATIRFFTGLPADAWQRRGRVNGYGASVRGLAYHIVAHELHHQRVLRSHYLAAGSMAPSEGRI